MAGAESDSARAPGPTNESSAARTLVEPEKLRVRVIETFEHDATSYTQGLLWLDGMLVESTGEYGRSKLLRWRLGEPDASERVDLERDLFGEGLALVGEELIQLTWRAGIALVYDAHTLEPTRRLRYDGEGWGLAFDGERLILSDGTHVLKIADPKDLRVTSRLEVRRRGLPQDNLNELEWVDGALYANVYQSDEIVRIDPQTGAVTAVIDASGLLDEQEARSSDVLNGIAYRPSTDTFLITGKHWPRLFEVVFEPAS